MLDRFYHHISRKAPIYLWLLAAMAAFGHYFTVSINVSDSLPGTVFLVQKGAKPGKGDLAAFRYNGGGPYERGSLFLKRVLGIPGSVVTATDRGDGYRDYFVDGQFAGSAKPLSKELCIVLSVNSVLPQAGNFAGRTTWARSARGGCPAKRRGGGMMP
ncbi:S26 family signal peptidase [Azovibrio restrictus]|uniref:S26 family signal peptidase n=1 Tax=Azovibrio restrictus TaxID=146938 RepID=UPI0026EBB90B|nr:S26 family signal peptidase [Azovibrio restrictus]